MGTLSKSTWLWLGGIALAALGCRANGFPERDEPAPNDVADVADSEDGEDFEQDEDVAESSQPLIETGQSLIVTQNGKCLSAGSKTRVTLQKKRCRPDLIDSKPRHISARFAWYFEADGRIRSAVYPDRCLTLPGAMGGAVGLAPCSVLQDEQQVFKMAPQDGEEGQICSKVQVPPAINICLTHNGVRLVYSTFQPVAPLWLRVDA